MNVLVAVPVRPDEHPFFCACLDKYEAAFPVYNPGFTFDWARDERDWREGRTRLAAIAAARNAILDDHLRPEHDLVLTMDSDVVALPFALPALLYNANPAGVTAPEVLIEGTASFYDTAGFLEHNGSRCRQDWPYFVKAGPLVSLASVGTVYLAPASLFRETRYAAEPAGLTDHEEVCAAARKLGMTVACLAGIEAYHAALPLYGKVWR